MNYSSSHAVKYLHLLWDLFKRVFSLPFYSNWRYDSVACFGLSFRNVTNSTHHVVMLKYVTQKRGAVKIKDKSALFWLSKMISDLMS